MAYSFQDLARTFEKLEATSSIISTVETLARFLRRLSPEEARATAYLLQGRVAPPFQSIEFGMAERMVVQSIAQAYRCSDSWIRHSLARSGDLGLVAEMLTRGKGKGLTILRVFNELKAIAEIAGAGSQAKKIAKLAQMLAATSGTEAKYIVRSVASTQRIGVAEMTYLSALALAHTRTKENKAILESAYNVLPDLGEIGFRLAAGGLPAIKRIKPAPGLPVRMMLASRVQNLGEVPAQIAGGAFVECKYDGERAQVHVDDRGTISIFSRRLEDITHQYPEIVSQVRQSRIARKTIFEGEIVAYDFGRRRLLPFQVVMQRKRKHDVAAYARKVPVVLFVFDILLSRGTNLLGKPIAERRKLLEREIGQSRLIRHSDYIVARQLADTERYFRAALRRGAEGVVIKSMTSPYKAGRRSADWIKFKKEYERQLADTFDLAVVGALHGRGSRAGSYGSLLLAAFDPKTNKYCSLTKVGAGFTAATLASLPRLLQRYRIPEKHRLVETGVQADIWFTPAKVVEISGANLTVSPVHTVARARLKSGGLALRFPRFIRFRDDKSAEQATMVDEIYDLYRLALRPTKAKRK